MPYKNLEEYKQYQKKYQESVIYKKYRQSEKGKIKDKKYQVSEKGRATKKKYRQTEKGKSMHKAEIKKSNAKRNRNLGFIPLMSNPFPKEISIDYHHINNTFVVPVPRQVHKSMLGKNHRIKVNDWIEEIIGDVGVC